MEKRMASLTRKLSIVVSAGVLLQAGGCMIDANTLSQQLITSSINSLLASVIFGFFGLAGIGF